MSLLQSIIVAATSAVGKIYVIGLIGALSCKYPKRSPLIPPSSLSIISRMTFNMLMLPLLYTGVASSVEVEELEVLYPVILISLSVIILSFLVTICMGYLPCFAMQNSRYFVPLCMASTIPNVIAIPIILFPVLCEYEVVQELVMEDIMKDMTDEDIDIDEINLIDECRVQSNVVVFTYLLGVDILLWSFGQRILLNSSKRAAETTNEENETELGFSRKVAVSVRYYASCAKDILIDIMKQPPFIAVLLGLTTACISPLQSALFEVGGSLRVIGSVLESLSSAGATFVTIIVAASLVKDEKQGSAKLTDEEGQVENGEALEALISNDVNCNVDSKESYVDKTEEPGLPTPNLANVDIANFTSIDRVQEKQQGKNLDNDDGRNDGNKSFEDNNEQKTIKPRFNCFKAEKRESMKIYIWQIASRLFVTPGIVFLILIKLECSGILDSIPNIGKLVFLINSAAPGALVIVVVLKANGRAEEASAVSKIYLPSYIISIFSLTAWTTLGLLAFRSDSGVC